MAAKKMFPPGEVDRLLGNDYDEVQLRISFRLFHGQILMMFSDHVEWIRMTSGGARKVAALLTEKADELDRLGVPASATMSSRTAAPAVAPARVEEKKKSVEPRRRVAAKPVTR
jgi:hypothetical protein